MMSSFRKFNFQSANDLRKSKNTIGNESEWVCEFAKAKSQFLESKNVDKFDFQSANDVRISENIFENESQCDCGDCVLERARARAREYKNAQENIEKSKSRNSLNRCQYFGDDEEEEENSIFEQLSCNVDGFDVTAKSKSAEKDDYSKSNSVKRKSAPKNPK